MQLADPRAGASFDARAVGLAALALALVPLLALVVAVRPLLALPAAALLALAATAVRHPRRAGRSLATVATLLVLLAAALLIALDPPLGLLCAPLALVAAAVRAWPRAAAAIGAALCVLVLALLVALVPGWTALAAPATLVVVPLVVRHARTISAFVFRSVRALVCILLAAAGIVALALAPASAAVGALVLALVAALWSARRALPALARSSILLPVGIVLGCAVVAALLVAWPATTLLGLTVALTLVLAWRAPALALAVGVLLLGFEGSIKLLLAIEETPLPGSRESGAAAIDLALFAGVAGVVLRDRLRTPRALWSDATRIERIAIVLLGLWLVLSVVQIAQGGELMRGLRGFRLFQAYVLVGIASAVVFAQPAFRRTGVRVLLLIGLVVGGYAALRVAFGPSEAERAFALSVESTTQYGGALRAIGSFSSAVGLISFVTPMAVFGLVAGLLVRRLRVLGWSVGAICLVAVLGSYGRASLFGIALGLLCALALVLVTGDMAARTKAIAAGAVVLLLVGTYGGALVASQASDALRERAQGIIDPLGDESTQLRFDTWRDTLADAANKPLGQGLGAVGSASSSERRRIVTTDNSFLKVLIEQGYPGLGLFVLGFLGFVLVLARRLRRAVGEARAVGVAALAGFLTFLGISVSGEYVEQPGKVVAWALLGLAAALALSRAGEEEVPG